MKLVPASGIDSVVIVMEQFADRKPSAAAEIFDSLKSESKLVITIGTNLWSCDMDVA